MPIAHCQIKPGLNFGSQDLIDLWSLESGQPAQHMTVNLTEVSQQFGVEYAVMANLTVPSAWSTPQISALQVGLAKALSQYFRIEIDQVHVITSIISSGTVVESGKEVTW